MDKLNFEDFYKVFSSLPLSVRDEIILVMPEKGPITWKVAYLEIFNETDLGKEIYKKLKDLNII
ncbi:MAG: hypothetical protein UW68_C0040G0018 [Candidatus Collierbacteria bacterium GW2011_GWB1_44_6]|uniref:Uncharacterized protein n=2 Tax=Candidatus Collieribacteriota TaxID=1752725 RepID=A0A0G1JLA2_9BACT|nr:MAG: hypothetical protein UV68_C0002G0009 [Candidatus Collierbacteria bacterium GW2011_GWC2_43_12]KKT72336.1 MAG: hypothetical protein UW68_C0040G0018 [Candidatus Collierbacteria bacterium GW2011_GWB1_44_6]